MENPPEVFVSYAHQSSEVDARLLHDALEERGIAAFVSALDIAGGSDYPSVLADAIANAQLLVLLLTDAANRSSFVHNELAMAIAGHREVSLQVLPVLLEPVVPAPRLKLLFAATQCLDLADRTQAEQIAAIVQAVAMRLTPQGEGTARRPTVDVERTGSSPRGMRIALLYKRGAQPDETLLAFLDHALNDAGHSVFIDRHMRVGVEWAKQIAAEIAAADAVVPLLSPSSIGSEMLAYELQVAHETAQSNGGKPRIFPLRVGIEGPLNGELGAILNPLQYGLWRGEGDNDRLFAELTDGLLNPPRVPPTPVGELEAVGGAMPLDSKFYVERPADSELRAAIARRDSVLLIKGPRQTGKTSLLARGLREARQAGVAVVLTDLQKLSADQLADLEGFYRAIGQILTDQLDLPEDPGASWRPGRSPHLNFERWLRTQVMGGLQGPLLWALDEVDRLFALPYGGEVFALFRTWHNERASDPGKPWGRLTIAIAYATEARLFISDPNQSPFNIGTLLELDDFSLEQVADLNRRYGSPLREGEEQQRFQRLLGGQPFLVRRGLDVMVRRQLGLAELAARADQDDGPFGDHLRRILMLLVRDQSLCDLVRGFLRSPGPLPPDGFHRLRCAGLLAGPARDKARFRCDIYASYLARQLL